MPSTSYYDDASSDTMTSQAATNDATMTSETATNITEMASRSLMTSLTPPPTAGGGSDVAGVWLVGEEVGWYTVIAVLSALVLIGLCFTVCRLVMKASAHEKASEGDWHRDSLLFSRKDSVIPISLHFHPTTEDALGSFSS